MNGLTKYAAFCWLLVCVLLLAALVVLLPKTQLNSSVLALLPNQTGSTLPDEIRDAFLQRLDRQLVWMISPGEHEGTAPRKWWLDQLQHLHGLKTVRGPIDASQQQEWGQFHYRHRNGLIDTQTRERLQNGGGAQADWVLGQIYSAFAGVSGKELEGDPLLLVRGGVMAQQQSSTLELSDGWLSGRDASGRRWYFLYGELAGSSYSIRQASEIVERLDGLQKELSDRWPETRVLSRGTLFYSNYASQMAERDVSTLGPVTLIGVLLLIYLAFRSFLPLLLCLLSIGIGALAGTVATLLVFGELHLITMVLSISITGVSVDYAIYFLTERMVHGAHDTPKQSMHKIFPTLLGALLTTAGAYLTMVLAPFPGLQQLAVFATVGLTAACLTVICWYPGLTRRLPVRPVPVQHIIMGWLRMWETRTLRIGLPSVILLISLLGLTRLHVDDDISQLQALPQTIRQQEQEIIALSGQGTDQKWFVVFGATGEETLQRLERLQLELEKAKEAGLLQRYRLLPLSSQQRQQNDLALLQAAARTLNTRFREAGIDGITPDFNAMPVLPKDWVDSAISEGWRLLWLTLPDGQSSVLVPVDGVTDSQALGQLVKDLPGTDWVDRKSEFDQLFASYRFVLGWLLAAAVTVITLSFIVRLGARAGLLSMLPLILSLVTGLAALTLSGLPLNLFSLLGLVLVLGLGVNYTLFFSNPRSTTPTTSMLAVTLAALTTLLTLGMLVFSSTRAISGFGTVLCSGLFTVFLLSPMALPDPWKQRK